MKQGVYLSPAPAGSSLGLSEHTHRADTGVVTSCWEEDEEWGP